MQHRNIKTHYWRCNLLFELPHCNLKKQINYNSQMLNTMRNKNTSCASCINLPELLWLAVYTVTSGTANFLPQIYERLAKSSGNIQAILSSLVSNPHDQHHYADCNNRCAGMFPVHQPAPYSHLNWHSHVLDCLLLLAAAASAAQSPTECI